MIPSENLASEETGEGLVNHVGDGSEIAVGADEITASGADVRCRD